MTYDFRESIVYKELKKSDRFFKKVGDPKNIWEDPENYVKTISEYIYDRTQSYDMDFWHLIFGYEGSGKSSLSLMEMVNILKLKGYSKEEILDKIKKNTIFVQHEYAKSIFFFSQNNIVREPIIIDDAHFIFGKYLQLTNETWFTLQLARFIRDQRIIHILNTQVPQQLYIDIWFERVNTFEYCFAIDVMDKKTQRIKSRHFYVAFYNMDTSQILKQYPRLIRNVLDWKKILTRIPPTIITRFDFLFPNYSVLYYEYKKIKRFYKEVYSALRWRGLTKGRYIEIMFNILGYIVINNLSDNVFDRIEYITNVMNDLPNHVREKILSSSLIVKTPAGNYDIHPILLKVIEKYKDIIKLRYKEEIELNSYNLDPNRALQEVF